MGRRGGWAVGGGRRGTEGGGGRRVSFWGWLMKLDGFFGGLRYGIEMVTSLGSLRQGQLR